MKYIRTPSFAVFITLLVTLAAYWPGLYGPFLLDDFTNLVRLEFLDGTVNGLLMAIFNNTGDILNRPISFASYLINSNDWPENPFSFKFVNLLLHLATGLFLLLLLWQIPKPKEVNTTFFNLVVFSLWMLSPLHISSVLYVVQRMTVLSGLFGLIFLLFYVRLRVDEGRDTKFAIVAIIFLACSFLSKENGLSFILLAGVLEIYLRLVKEGGASKKNDWVTYALLLAICTFFSLFIYKSLLLLGSYERREFSLFERLLVEGQVLLDYMRLSLLPDVNYMSLFHDNYEWNVKSKLATGLLSWLIHIALIGVVWLKRKKYPVVFLGILWFYSAHIIESTILPLELMFEHRNYIPSIGLYFIVAFYMGKAYQMVKMKNELLKHVAFSVPLIIFGILLLYRASIWSTPYAMFSKWAYYKPDSRRAQYGFVLELERNGLIEHAYGNSLDLYKKFDSLGFYLYSWRVGCLLERNNQSEFIDSGQIKEKVHSSEIGHEVDLLAKLWAEGKCIPEGYGQSEIDEFFSSILQMKMLDKTPKYKAKLIEKIGKYYENIRLYNKAVEYKLALYDVQPSVDTALRNAEFALKFNLLDYAGEFINKARIANKKLPFLAADRSGLIDMLDQELKRRSDLEQESKGNN